MANRIPTLVLSAVAAACSLSAQANGPTQADFAKVVLYANVTIAQDSPNAWGIWEELEAPAAGPQAPLPPIAGTSDMFRPLGAPTSSTPTPVTPPIVAACSSGALCGFGVMSLSSRSWNEDRLELAATSAGGSDNPGFGFQLFPTTETAPTWLPESMSIRTESIKAQAQFEYNGPNLSFDGPLVRDGSNLSRDNPAASNVPAGIEAKSELVNIVTDLESAPSGVQSGRFRGELRIAQYVSGGPDLPSQSGTEQIGSWHGAWGVTTSASDMDNLRLSEAQASYTGSTFNAAGTNTGAVKMSVNFGSSTFKADFHGGSGVANPFSSGTFEQTTSGFYQFNGAMSFSAEGTISGSQFSSNSVTVGGPNPSSMSGNVKGAFVGQNAASVIGVADVSAVANIPGTQPVTVRYAAPFTAVKDTPIIRD